MSLVRCEHVTFSYEGIPAAADLHFEVNAGDFLAIVGENGAGKSTLVKGLLRLKKPSAGSLIYGDGLTAGDIGYLPQQTPVQKDFPASVEEVVLTGCVNQLGRRIFFPASLKKAADEKMEMLGITGLKKRCYRDLSGGQQQRVLLARALCAAKKLLLLDEPVTGLDPIVSADMYRLIRMLHDEHMTIIMVSHDVAGAVREADHILQLDGTQKFFGTAEEYRASQAGRYLMHGGII
jgi:zinc transport system ATP-binding protein